MKRRRKCTLKNKYNDYESGATHCQAQINSFVDDACLQYLHCTDEDQQSKKVRLSTVE